MEGGGSELGALRFSQRVEIFHLCRSRIAAAVDVVGEGQNRRRVVPLGRRARLGKIDQLAERERAGIYSGTAGELVDVLPAVGRITCDSITSSISASISPSSSAR